MTPSELKAAIESSGREPHFFSKSTMRFFGDTMRNYGVRKGPSFKYNYDANGNYIETPRQVETWELYRKRPVKNGLKSSAYFDTKTFRRVFPQLSEKTEA